MRFIWAVIVAILVTSVPVGSFDRAVAPGLQGAAREPHLDQALADRRHDIEAVLTSEAKKKLTGATRDLLGRMAKVPDVPDPTPIARSYVQPRFGRLSTQQMDLLTFYVMAAVARWTEDVDLLNKRAAGSTKEEGIEDLHKAEVKRLTHLMDRGSPYATAMTRLFKRAASIPDSVVANLR